MPTLPRRSFLSRFGIGLTAGGVTLGSGVAGAQVPAAQDGRRFQPARYPQDDWYDQVPGKHRFVFDNTSPEAASLGLNFVSNFFTASQTGYGLKDEDLAVIMVMRHSATPFAYSDAIWQKYGVPITARTKYNDPVTNKPPTLNIYNVVREEGQQAGRTVSALTARGVRLAVCQLSTRAYAGAIATATGQKQEAVFEELKASLIGGANSRLVPAGVLAVNRAQEHGYTFAFAS